LITVDADVADVRVLMTIARRTLLVTAGKCSPDEYPRMVPEKLTATARETQALARSNKAPDRAAIVSPWHKRAKSNSRRVQRKRRI
jgi:predicted nuclease of predicted toxin-antitoxin system